MYGSSSRSARQRYPAASLVPSMEPPMTGFFSRILMLRAGICASSIKKTAVANRSALAQSVGYLFAALGPVLFGQLHDIFQSWLCVQIVLLLLMITTIAVGFKVIKLQK